VVLGSTVTAAAVPVPVGPPVAGVPHPSIVGKVPPPALEIPPAPVDDPPAPVEDPPALVEPPVLVAIPPVPLPPAPPPELVLDPQPDVKATVSSAAPARTERERVDDRLLLFMKISLLLAAVLQI
jgi:hypothetical protein